MMRYLKRKAGKTLDVGPLVATYPGAARLLCSLTEQNKAIVVDSTRFIFVGPSPGQSQEFAEKWMALHNC